MGLINSLFGRSGSGASDQDLSDAQASGFGQTESRGNLRRELVHVVLRDTMRAHAIPSDWMHAVVLPLAAGPGRPGLHVVLIVRDGHQRMLAYLPAFQESFIAALERFDGPVSGWMNGPSWQFDGLTIPTGDMAGTPPLAQAKSGAPTRLPVDAAGEWDAELQEDLRKLFAIRDGAFQEGSDPAVPPRDFEPTQPLR